MHLITSVSNADRWKEIQMTNVDDCTTDSHRQSTGLASSAPHILHRPIFRRTFRTAGTIVAWATIGTLLLEIALVVLVVRM